MKLHVGQGSTLGALTLFPIWNESGGRRRYTTSVRDLMLGECTEPVVQEIHVANPGHRAVLVCDGQLFEGGLQHRMATQSLLIPSHHERNLPVACVEAGRWGGGDRSQRSEGRRASQFVRSGYGTGGQTEVWSRISRTAAVASATTSYAEMRFAADLQRQADAAHGVQLVPDVRPLPGQAGVLVGIGGYPMLLEVFDDATTLREQFDAIVEAVRHDAQHAPPVPTPGRRARRLVARLSEAYARLEPSGFDTPARSAPDHVLDVARLDHGGRAVHLRAVDRRHPVVLGT